MNETPDLNLAAYLIFRGNNFTYRTEDQGVRKRIYFVFPDLTPAEYKALQVEYLNSEYQQFVDAQRKVKNVIRNLAV